jgi:Ca2+-binding EF-hand superfamily protein
MWNINGFAAYMEVHPQIASAMFKMMDDDGDGTLTFDEFVRGYGFITKGTPQNRLNLLFKIFDLDGSDTLDKAETKIMVRTVLTSFHETAQSADGPGGSGIAAQAKIMKAKAAGKKLR